jgi:hypothetical protein
VEITVLKLTVKSVRNTPSVTNPALALNRLALGMAAKHRLVHLLQIAIILVPVLWPVSTRAAVIIAFSQIALHVLFTLIVSKTSLALSRLATLEVASRYLALHRQLA